MVLESSLPYDERRFVIAIAVTDLGGEQDKCNVQTMHTTSFNIEVRALTYIMIFNFYPVKNLTTFSQPRTLFLHVLLKGKEIDICAQLYHLLTKRVRKRKSWMTLPLAAMIMKIFLTHSVDLPSSWAPIKREDPISAVTMTRSRACLPSAKKQPKRKKSQAEESTTISGNNNDKIDQFILKGDDILPPSPYSQHQAPDRLDQILARMDHNKGPLMIMRLTPEINFHTSKSKLASS